jgi:hypothetical protein
MNSEQILLLVAALGVAVVVTVTTLGPKNKKSQTSVASGRTESANHGNRAQRRKRHA